MKLPTFCWIRWDPIILEIWTIFLLRAALQILVPLRRILVEHFGDGALRYWGRSDTYFWNKNCIYILYTLYVLLPGFLSGCYDAKILILCFPRDMVGNHPSKSWEIEGGGSLWKNHLRWNDNAGAWELLQLPLRPVADGPGDVLRDGGMEMFRVFGNVFSGR